MPAEETPFHEVFESAVRGELRRLVPVFRCPFHPDDPMVRVEGSAGAHITHPRTGRNVRLQDLPEGIAFACRPDAGYCGIVVVVSMEEVPE